MRYITVFGKLNNKYLKSGKSVYWLTEDTQSHEWGFALLEKTWLGSYNLIRFSILDLMSEPGEFLKVRDELEGGK